MISLPNIRLYFLQNILFREYLFLAGGRAPAKFWLQKTAAGRTIYCIDHGADSCHSLNLIPAVFVGDCDSVQDDTREWLKRLPVKMHQFPSDKDKTDTQLAFDLLENKKEAFIILSGAFGGRLDHLFSVLYSFVNANVCGCIADDHEFIFILRKDEQITLDLEIPPKSISLLPLSPECEGVSLTGVHWPLHNAALNQNNLYAISNRLSPDGHRISAANKTGILALYLCWNEPTA